MPTATAAPHDAHGWGIRLTFLGHVVAELGRGDAAPVSAGERRDCDLVVPGLGERVLLTEGARLVVPPGLVGEVEVGGRVIPSHAEPGFTLAPGDRATLRVAAHPEVTLELRRVERERLPWSARFHGRDLARQLVTGAALVAMVALLWRVERVENVLKLRGDPLAEDDSPLLRVMFAPTVEPIAVIRARELFAARLPPPPPPPAPEPGPDDVSAAPAPIAFTREGPVEVAPPVGALAEAPAVEAPARDRKVRRGKRANEAQMVALLGADSAVFDKILVADTIDGVEGGVLGALVGGVEGGVVGGLIGAKLDAPDAPLADLYLPDGTVALGHVSKDLVEAPATQPPDGVHSHPEGGAAATRGERDGLAAVAPDTSCADPEVVRKQQIDVVFAVDVSTTMNFMLGKIGREIAAVDAAVRAHNLDARYGLVVFVDDVLVTGGGQPFADLAALQQELAKWQAFTAGNRQIHSEAHNLDWPENSLDALHAAATEFAWRPAATTLRAVVHATDDDFGEAPAVQSGQPVQHGYRQTVAALRAAEVRVFSFAAKIGGQCECLDVRSGLFAPYRGQKAIPAATGGAVFDIDEVASGALNFGAAVSGALQTAVCTHYPLSPLAAPKRG